jgi:hypothetical protein
VTPPGSAIFVSPAQLPELEIRASTLIAIENPACLLNFEKALRHFPAQNLDDIALVLRWSWGSAWQEWIRPWRGNVLHFPDYDPAGLRIFASEVLSRRPEAKLMIPNGFETLLKERGSRKLYLRQEPLSNELANDPRMKSVSAPEISPKSPRTRETAPRNVRSWSMMINDAYSARAVVASLD